MSPAGFTYDVAAPQDIAGKTGKVLGHGTSTLMVLDGGT